MKEDNQYYSETKEGLRKTIQELRETVSHVYHIPVFLLLKSIISNKEKDAQVNKVSLREMKKITPETRACVYAQMPYDLRVW